MKTKIDELKKGILNRIGESLNFVAMAFFVLTLGAIFFSSLAVWVFLSFAYSLGIEMLILGGTVILYVFSLVSYILWSSTFKLNGGRKWKDTKKINKR